MITDFTEAIYRQKIMPGLCAVDIKHPFTHEHKIYLLPKDSKNLLQQVNQWIKTNLGYKGS